MFFSIFAAVQLWWKECVEFVLFLFGKDDENPYFEGNIEAEKLPLPLPQPSLQPPQPQPQPQPPQRFEDKYKQQYAAAEDSHVLTNEADLQAIEDAHKAVQDAYDLAVKRKLEGCKNNFVMECTPLGNVCMRYNVDTEVFEYYADHTIPYRFLETVGRRYVSVYGCKPLFVDMEEELRRVAREGNVPIQMPKLSHKDAMLVAKAKSARQQQQQQHPNANVIQQHAKKTTASPNESKLVKEHSNHYTCVGKLSNFNPLWQRSRLNCRQQQPAEAQLSYREFAKRVKQQQQQHQKTEQQSK